MSPDQLRRALAPLGALVRRVVRFWGRHRVLAALVLVAVVIVGGAGIDLLRIRDDLKHGQDTISNLQLQDLDAGLVPTITHAAAQLHHADRIAHHSPFLRLFSVVPVVKDQVDGVRDMTSVADDLGGTGVRASKAIDKVLKAAGTDASKRVDLLDTVSQQLDVVQGVLSKVQIGAHGRLLTPLANARKELVTKLDKAPARIEEARFYIGGLRRLLVGPSNYLLLAANNAEMRGGAGSPLSGGVVTIRDGDIAFGDFRQLVSIHVPRPPEATAIAPGSWNTTYHNWVWGISYLETSASPNFSVTGPIYQSMSPAAGFGPVDGVLEVDAVALKDLLSVIGPVTLDGVKYDQGNVEQQILNENYLRFGNALTTADRNKRIELQSALAKEIFNAFKARDVPITKLAQALRGAAGGRHLIAYSSDPAVQTLWRSIGANGALSPYGLMVAVENVSATKLDWYIDPVINMTTFKASDGSWGVRLNIEIDNPKLKKTSTQVDGVFPGLHPGDQRSMVAAYLPAAAYNIRTPDNTYSESGADPPMQMVAQRITVPRGESRIITFEFSLPSDVKAALILPSGRVRPETYIVNGKTYLDAGPVIAQWGQAGKTKKGPGAPGVAGVLALAGVLVLLVGVRARLQQAATRPMRPLPDLLQQAPSLAFVLFVAALGMLVAAALIGGAT